LTTVPSGKAHGMGEKIAKAKEVVGYATGDRQVEARGRVEEKLAASDTDQTGPTDDETDDAVAAEQAQVRKERGEYQPERPPRR